MTVSVCDRLVSAVLIAETIVCVQTTDYDKRYHRISQDDTTSIYQDYNLQDARLKSRSLVFNIIGQLDFLEPYGYLMVCVIIGFIIMVATVVFLIWFLQTWKHKRKCAKCKCHRYNKTCGTDLTKNKKYGLNRV